MAGDKKTQTTTGSYQNGVWVPSTQGRDLDQDTLDKEKFQDTSPLVAASKAAAEKKKSSPSPAPLTGLAAAADAEARKRKAKSQAEAVEK